MIKYLCGRSTGTIMIKYIVILCHKFYTITMYMCNYIKINYGWTDRPDLCGGERALVFIRDFGSTGKIQWAKFTNLLPAHRNNNIGRLSIFNATAKKRRARHPIYRANHLGQYYGAVKRLFVIHLLINLANVMQIEDWAGMRRSTECV